jgi:hypothetical protein
MSGKGSSPRPIPNRKQYEDNYDAIFGTKEQKPEYKKCEKCGQYWETDTPGNNHNCPCPEDALQ